MGDTVTIQKQSEIAFAKSVEVLPFADTIAGLSGDLFQVYVKPYFLEKYRPLYIGDTFIVRGAMRAVEFKVTSITGLDDKDATFAIIGPETRIEYENTPLKRSEDDRLDEIGYDDIGGCGRQLGLIRELVELPLRHPQIFQTIGIPPPKGVLMHGPPGSGIKNNRVFENKISITFGYFHHSRQDHDCQSCCCGNRRFPICFKWS